MMNTVDSSCWLEYLAGTPTGELVAEVIEDTKNLVVPTMTLYEVFKKLLVERDEDSALLVAAHMKQGKVVVLDADLSILAARIGKDCKLPLADSIIYACSRQMNSTLWTQDSHFEGLESVRYLPKHSSHSQK